jgi:hypothetical protein
MRDDHSSRCKALRPLHGATLVKADSSKNESILTSREERVRCPAG